MSNVVHVFDPAARDPEQDARELPFNIRAEQALLGLVLLNNEAFHRVAGFLQGAHFFEGVHGEIFDACRRAIEAGGKADPVVLARQFGGHPSLKDQGGASYLSGLASSFLGGLAVEEYARAIFDLWQKRELIRLAEDVRARAYDAATEETAAELMQAIGAEVERIADGGPDAGASVDLSGAANATVQKAQDIANGKVAPGLKTELVDLDNRLGGMKRQALIVLAARPSMGKTALAARIASRAAQQHPDKAVAYFSLEEGADGLAARLLAARTGIPYESILSGRVDGHQLEQLSRAQAAMPNNLVIDETGGITLEAIRARALRLHRRAPVALLVVDHIGLMRAPRHLERQDRRLHIEHFTAGLKALAKEIGAPVLALSQLNRQVEQRDPPIPRLADLRESGSIEQDADVVMFVFREEYYLDRSKPKDGDKAILHDAKLAKARNTVDVIIDKNRHGSVGTVHLFCEIGLNRFGNLERREDAL